MSKEYAKGYNGKNPPGGNVEEIEFSTGNTFKDIVMHQLHKVVTFSNVEFRGGYYTTLSTKEGNDKEIYVQDTREVYSNAVFSLALLLQPKFDDEMKNEFNKIQKKIKEITQYFIDNSTPTEEVVLGDSFYTEEKDKILLETYKNKRLEQYQKLFARISDMLSRINYLDVMGGSY